MDFLVNILETNINYSSILVIIFIYILLLWLMFSLWVGVDAKKRYKNTAIALGFSLLVLVLNIPALIFYLIIRPENDEDNVLYLHSDDNTTSGVNVPIINFKGEDGFVLSLQLKVGNIENSEKKSKNNMNINVEFDSDNEKMEKTNIKANTVDERKVENKIEKTSKGKEVIEKIKLKLNRLIEKSKSFLRKTKNNVKNYIKKVNLNHQEEKKK